VFHLVAGAFLFPVFRHVLCSSVASGLLEYATKKAQEDSEIAEIYLHVQTNNENAIAFYLKHGFEQSHIIKDYYKKIDPADCYLFRKVIKPNLYIAPSSNENDNSSSSSANRNNNDMI
jgi:chromosomal replication initiation ATPase DnaA